jgi:enoyl-CoA hydratase/carnithine racemase
MSVVLYEAKDGVATITLNRPERLNAWNGDIENAYFDYLEDASGDAAVKVIVVTGAGRGFCAGADMDLLQGIGEAGGAGNDRPRRPSNYPMRVPKLMIAAINGACAGIGFVHALMCDLRFAAAGAKFTSAFARRGLIAEHGSSFLLPRIAGTSVALDVMLSARVFLAEEAKEMGIVNRVYEPAELMEQTLAYARDVAENCSPLSMSRMKDQIHRHPLMDVDQAMSETGELMRMTLGEPDFKEGVSSFVEKRPPHFAPFSVGAEDLRR